MQKLFILIFFFLLLTTPLCAATVPVTGKVAVDGKGVSGVIVSAWPLDTVSFKGDAPYHSAASEEGGVFHLELPSGSYYFLAAGQGRFGYYGRNPVTVGGKGIEALKLSLPLESPVLPEGEAQVETGVLGKVTHNGKPLAGASLMVYTDLNTQLKGLGLGMSVPSDDTGYVEVPLPAGTYYVVARMRQSGQFSGPLQAGDFFGYFAGNPLVIKEGEVARIGIDMVEVPQKVKNMAGSMFGNTSISGRVLNVVGSPVVGVRVLLYDNSMMLNRPLYVSQPTNANGEYVLSFPKGGTYYLQARNKLGGAPGPGELIGRYSKSQDSSIRLRSGQHKKGVDMLVEEMW